MALVLSDDTIAQATDYAAEERRRQQEEAARRQQQLQDTIQSQLSDPNHNPNVVIDPTSSSGWRYTVTGQEVHPDGSPAGPAPAPNNPWTGNASADVTTGQTSFGAGAGFWNNLNQPAYNGEGNWALSGNNPLPDTYPQPDAAPSTSPDLSAFRAWDQRSPGWDRNYVRSIASAYGFTPQAVDQLTNTGDFRVGPGLVSGGGTYNPQSGSVDVNSNQPEAIIHELSHKWQNQTYGDYSGPPNTERLSGFAQAVRDLANEQDPRYTRAADLAREYLKLGIPPNEQYAGLASGIMGDASLLPDYMKPFYDQFSGSRGNGSADVLNNTPAPPANEGGYGFAGQQWYAPPPAPLSAGGGPIGEPPAPIPQSFEGRPTQPQQFNTPLTLTPQESGQQAVDQYAATHPGDRFRPPTSEQLANPTLTQRVAGAVGNRLAPVMGAVQQGASVLDPVQNARIIQGAVQGDFPQQSGNPWEKIQGAHQWAAQNEINPYLSAAGAAVPYILATQGLGALAGTSGTLGRIAASPVPQLLLNQGGALGQVGAAEAGTFAQRKWDNPWVTAGAGFAGFGLGQGASGLLNRAVKPAAAMVGRELTTGRLAGETGAIDFRRLDQVVDTRTGLPAKITTNPPVNATEASTVRIKIEGKPGTEVRPLRELRHPGEAPPPVDIASARPTSPETTTVYHGSAGAHGQELKAGSYVTPNEQDAWAFARATGRQHGAEPHVASFEAQPGALRPPAEQGLAAARGSMQVSDPALLKAAGGPPRPPTDIVPAASGGEVLPPVNMKLTQAMKDATISAPERAQLIAAGRSRQAGGIVSSIQGPGSFAERQATAAARMSGQILPNMKPVGDRFTADEITQLTAQIDKAHADGIISQFQWKTAGPAFNALMTAGRQLQPAERTLLGKIFGPEFAAAIPKNPREFNLWKETVGILGIPQTFSTAFDWSNLLRQAAVLGAGHPTAWGKMIPALFKATRSEAGAAEVMARVEALPFVKGTGELDGYGFRDVQGHISSLDQFTEAGQMEPQYASLNNSFVSRMTQKFPGIRASERAFVVPMNQLRGQVYNDVATKMWDSGVRDVQQYKATAAVVNHASGWGDFKVGQITDGVNAFFSPRNLVAKFQTVLDPFVQPGSLFKPSARQLAAKNLVAFTAENVAILSLLKFTGLADVQLDPRNSDFGKAKIGNLRVDLLAGYSPMVRLVERLRTGEIKTGTGNVMPADRVALVENFVRGKLGPLPSTLVDTLAGKNAVGTPANNLLSKSGLENQLYNILTPFLLQDVVEAIKYEGLKGGAIAAPLSFLGGGVQSYTASEVAQRDAAIAAAHIDIGGGKFAQKYSELNTLQRNQWDAANGKPVSTNPDTLKSQADTAALRAENTARQQEIDKNGPGQAWRDQRHLLEQRVAGQYDARNTINPFTGKPYGSAMDQAIADWSAVLDKATPGVVTDYTPVDAWRAANPDKAALVDEYMAGKANTDLTPMVTQYKAASKAVGNSGYFDLQDKAWAEAQKANPAYAKFPDYYAWRDAALKDIDAQLDPKIPKIQRDQFVQTIFDRQPGAVIFSKLKNVYETQWAGQHAKDGIANLAYTWGYYSPTKVERAIVGAGQ